MTRTNSIHNSRFTFQLKFAVGVISLLLLVGACADSKLHPIWLIESENNRVYLVGSVHVLRAEDYPLPEVFDQAYQDAERVVLEIPLSEINPADATRLTQTMALLSNGQTLETQMSPEKYAELSKQAKNANIDLRQFRQLEPWFAALSIAQIQMQRLGFEANRGIDAYFSQKAAKDNKKETGLENLKQQLEFMDQLPHSSQLQLLEDSLASQEDLKNESKQLIEAWRQGDLATLDQLFAQDLENNPALRQSILVDRNNRWLPQIIELINKRDDYLVVTGALHLAGEDGLLQLLRDNGYTIRQL